MIVVTARMLNEKNNIGRFIRQYGIMADMILLADGGSTDGSMEIARSFPRVEVRSFSKRVYGHGGVWRNPQGAHINFLIDWAESIGASWIFFDDIDSVPNRTLIDDFPSIIADAESYLKNFIFSPRMYIYGTEEWFPQMSVHGPCLWGWRADTGYRFDEEDEMFVDSPQPPEDERYSFDFPRALLHFFAPDEETIGFKRARYTETRGVSAAHPKDLGGRLEPLPDWAII